MRKQFAILSTLALLASLPIQAQNRTQLAAYASGSASASANAAAIAYSTSNTYHVGDVVTFGGVTYVSLVYCGSTPCASPSTTPSNWLPIGGVASLYGPVNAQTGTSYTLQLSDAPNGLGTVTMNNASANTVTVPPNSSVAYPVGTVLEFHQLGAGQTTIAAGSGVTINTPTSLSARAQYSTVAIKKLATDTWVAEGDLQ